MSSDHMSQPGSSSPVTTDLRARAAAVIPGGASTGSKRPDALFGPGASFGPTHFTHARGCRLTTADGAELVDCTMALGAVALGYADEMVTQAVAGAAGRGHVAGLSPVLEVELAERLCAIIPCAEQVRFLKSGAEGVAAAVRIARTHTGRSLVLGAGYFGWLDWWSTAPGVPAGAHADFRAIPFDDVAALEEAVAGAGHALAAVIIEPVVEHLPSTAWLTSARRLCDEHGAVLIYDEMKTGFRIRTGGFQEYSGIVPDMAIFGKAIANGYPLSAIVGRARVMAAAGATWISSTLASETTALAAAAAVLDRHEQMDVCDALWRTGEAMCGAVARAIATSGAGGVCVDGIPPMWFLRFDSDAFASRFLEHALEHGVLFKRGAYDFASLAHDDAAIERIEHAAAAALTQTAEELDAPG
ncbi:MAG TPA: aminotransferase class III-fold pyridoxal phosphate-dependent enzyme [Gemmatimonadaceae bacterium]|nr:aminotransferase class III-fold pyridoxal phosphate-dependent enzyme [Gemmatimonadaceae bacterium]